MESSNGPGWQTTLSKLESFLDDIKPSTTIAAVEREAPTPVTSLKEATPLQPRGSSARTTNDDAASAPSASSASVASAVAFLVKRINAVESTLDATRSAAAAQTRLILELSAVLAAPGAARSSSRISAESLQTLQAVASAAEEAGIVVASSTKEWVEDGAPFARAAAAAASPLSPNSQLRLGPHALALLAAFGWTRSHSPASLASSPSFLPSLPPVGDVVNAVASAYQGQPEQLSKVAAGIVVAARKAADAASDAEAASTARLLADRDTIRELRNRVAALTLRVAAPQSTGAPSQAVSPARSTRPVRYSPAPPGRTAGAPLLIPDDPPSAAAAAASPSPSAGVSATGRRRDEATLHVRAWSPPGGLSAARRLHNDSANTTTNYSSAGGASASSDHSAAAATTPRRDTQQQQRGTHHDRPVAATASKLRPPVPVSYRSGAAPSLSAIDYDREGSTARPRSSQISAAFESPVPGPIHNTAAAAAAGHRRSQSAAPLHRLPPKSDAGAPSSLNYSFAVPEQRTPAVHSTLPTRQPSKMSSVRSASVDPKARSQGMSATPGQQQQQQRGRPQSVAAQQPRIRVVERAAAVAPVPGQNGQTSSGVVQGRTNAAASAPRGGLILAAPTQHGLAAASAASAAGPAIAAQRIRERQSAVTHSSMVRRLLLKRHSDEHG